MTENRPISEEFPIPVVGALIYNDEKKIFLARGPKWGTQWTIAGGKIEINETAEAALKREIKEEVGIDIDQLEFLGIQDGINPAFYHRPAHFIFLDYLAHYASGEIRLSPELSEYQWIEPEKALATLAIEPTTVLLINKFLERENKKDACANCEEFKQGWQRALADYQNLQKEVALRRGEWAEMSEEQILREFILVYDNFKKAFAYRSAAGDDKKIEQWVQGISHIQRQFAEVLQRHKITEIPTVGEKFDPARHQAVSEEASEGAPSGTIVKEVEGGYLLGSRVIRAARVVIAK